MQYQIALGAMQERTQDLLGRRSAVSVWKEFLTFRTLSLASTCPW